MIKTGEINSVGDCDDLMLAISDIRFIYYNKCVYELIGGYAGKLHTHETIINHFKIPEDKCIRLCIIKDRKGNAFGIDGLSFSHLYRYGLEHTYKQPTKQDLDIIQNYVNKEIEFSERILNN